MTYDPSNIFAKILRGEILVTGFMRMKQLAFRDINPQAPTHVLIIPKGPYTSFADFSHQADDREILGFIRAVGQVARQLGIEEDGYRLLANHGENAHQEVPHFHIHVVGGQPLGPFY